MIKHLTLALAAIAALTGLENSYAYGTLGALITGESLATCAAGCPQE